MKTIDTLVEDIYALFIKDDVVLSTESATELGSNISKHVTNRINDNRTGGYLRLSNLGSPCDRKLWYSINSPDKATPLSAATRIKFLYGDILEELLLFLAKEAGHTVTGQQDTIEINGVKGHRDAVIDGRVVDVKSASTYSFQKFKEGRLHEDDAFGYIDQLNSYLYGSRGDDSVKEKDVASFLVIDKTLGNICLDTHAANGKDYDKLVDEKREVISHPEPPPRAFEPKPYGKSGNLALDTHCSYCPFKYECWPEVRTFLYSTGPVYLTTVNREPNTSIPEVDSKGEMVDRHKD